MSASLRRTVAGICSDYDGDRSHLLDILLRVQQELGHVGGDAIGQIADTLSIPRIEVEGPASFYAFISAKPAAQVQIRLCNDVPDLMAGAEKVAEGLEEELGIRFGETTADGKFSLEYAPCIGMSDQAPAALVNGLVMPRLGPGTARRGIQILKERGVEDLHGQLIRDYGDGNNSHDLVRAAVHNNIRLDGEVIFGETAPAVGLRNALAMSPAEVIREVKTARLRGRGGAGFPTGMKWEFTRAAGGDRRFIICNADEGEPGTFKDRVILTERPDLMFEGMTIGAYAIGAREGVVYLRGEYAYLHRFLEHVLEQRRRDGLLGRGICGKAGFDFDIRIQLGAGAYICGEETALISSCEGLRGDPKNRPPFPAQEGYLGKPTAINNVETLCCVTRILEMGPGWFSSMGTNASTGTKLLSISGDCTRRGVYEVPFGISLRKVFELCGAREPIAAQVSGPSGTMVGPDAFDRIICFDDLSTGGALVVLGPQRDPVKIASEFMQFFIDESCGYCTPCRVGNVLLKKRLDRILAGGGEPADLEYLEELGQTVEKTSRCGLGQRSAHPVLSTLKNFRSAYESRVKSPENGNQPSFDIHRALAESTQLTGRESVHFANKRESS